MPVQVSMLLQYNPTQRYSTCQQLCVSGFWHCLLAPEFSVCSLG